jgi:hypothetical protein
MQMNKLYEVNEEFFYFRYRLFGFSGSTVSTFSEAWWKCEFYIVLRSSVEASESNSQKKSRPTGKSGTASSWQCPRPHASQTTESYQELQWQLLEHPPYSPDLSPSDFHLFFPLRKSPWWQTFRWWRRDWNKGAKVEQTTVKRLLRCRFRCTGEAMRQVYQCWWKICRELNVSPGSNITCLTFYIHLWPIYWLSLVCTNTPLNRAETYI